MLRHYIKATINSIIHEVQSASQIENPFKLKYNYTNLILKEGQSLLTPYQKDYIMKTGKLTLFN